MVDFTQSEVTLLSHQLITHAADGVAVTGTAQAVASWIEGTVTVWHSNIEITANATGVSYILEGSFKSSGDLFWFPLVEFVSSTTAVALEALTATEPIAEKVIAVASTTGISSNQLIYIKDGTTLANSEWHRSASFVANTSVTMYDGMTVQKDSGDTMYFDAEIFSTSINLSGVSRVRMLANHPAATGSDIHFKSTMLAATDIE